jgi:LacI family transcriptional regulator
MIAAVGLGAPSVRRVTIGDVAARAGVSLATAGRALGDYGYVSDATKQRVWAAATALGYRPNHLARALASGSSRTIGLVAGDIENPFFAAVARGLSDVVEEHGYTVFLTNSDEDIEREKRSLDAFCTRSVDGLVIAAVEGTDSGVLSEVALDRPVVLIDRLVRALHVDTVTVDNVRGAADATRHLISLGHRRIGVVTDPPRIWSTRERLRGYRQTLIDAGIDVQEDLISVGPPTHGGGRPAALRLLDRADRPTAVFTISNTMTAGTLMAINELGLEVPHDVALVAFDDLDWMTLVRPAITVVSQPAVDIGRAAGACILDRISGDRARPKRVRLETTLIVRESCGAMALLGSAVR